MFFFSNTFCNNEVSYSPTYHSFHYAGANLLSIQCYPVGHMYDAPNGEYVCMYVPVTARSRITFFLCAIMLQQAEGYELLT